MAVQHKGLTIAGWFLTILVAAGLTFSAVMKFQYPPFMAKDWVDKFGYPPELAFTIGVVEVACLLVYLFPSTAVLGAVLLTGYLGGATATHVRINDMFVPPIVFGVIVWLGIFLREPRLRALLPVRRAMPPATPTN